MHPDTYGPLSREDFCPGAVDIQQDALGVLRRYGARLDVKREVLYGLALEYAAENEEQFLAYARESFPPR